MKRLFPLLSLIVFYFFTSGELLAKKPKVKNVIKGIEAAYETLQPTGMAVAVMKDGEVVYENAFGYADLDKKEALGTDYLFNIASCTKAFTAAAMALMVQEGKLKWEDRVKDHLPDFELSDPYISDHLRLKDLLCHRSGLGTFYGDLLWYGTEYSNEEIMRRMRHLPITNDFRGRFGYQNNMYMLAGMIVEKASGMTWGRFMQERFFNPLGMAQTRPSNDELSDGQKIALPHFEGKRIDPYDFEGTKPAASIFSSVEELLHWGNMLVNEGFYKGQQLLDPKTVAALFTPETIQRVDDELRTRGGHFKAYGLGWRLFDYGGRMVVEHNGGMPGYISKVALVPEEKLVLVVLNNGFDFFVNDLIRLLVMDEYLEVEPRDWVKIYKGHRESYNQYKKSMLAERLNSREKGTAPSQSLVAYCGTFEDKMYGKAEVRLEEGGLFIQLQPTAKYFFGKMSHWHHDSFKVTFNDPFLPFALINFEVTAEGSVTGFRIDLPNPDFHFFNLHFRSLE